MKSIWKGAISFGLIHIPVRLYSASKPRELKFKLLHGKDMGEIRYARICKVDGKEIPWEEVVKGYEYSEGDFVVLTEKDFEQADLKKIRLIEVLDFVEANEVDPMYYEAPYYLEPEKGADKAYALLCVALKRSKKVAIAHFILRNHEHLGVIRPEGDLLILHQLRYSAELVDPKDLHIPKEKNISKNQLDIALQLVDQMTKSFKPSEYSDSYSDALREMINKKAKGKTISIKKGEKPKSPKVQDIMALLKQSLEKKHKKKKAKSRRSA